MGIKYFCDKCGVEVSDRNTSYMVVNTRSNDKYMGSVVTLKTEHKAFLCDDCEKVFFNQISEIYKTFGFKRYKDY